MQENQHQIQSLIQYYFKLKKQHQTALIEEEEFEQIADYFIENNQLKEAEDAILLGLQAYPSSADILCSQADLLIIQNNFTQALQVLELATIYDPSNVSIVILKADALLGTGRNEEAAQIISEALQNTASNSEKINLLLGLSDVYDDYNQPNTVFDLLVNVLEIDSNNEEALYKICFWCDYTKRFDESIDLYKKVIDANPYNEIAWFNLGAAYQTLKLYEKSIDAYQYAIAIKADFDYAYRNLADAYLRLKKFKEALDALQSIVELNTADAVIYEAIGHCYHKLNNMQQARSHYLQAVDLSPFDAVLHYKLGTTYMQEAKWQKACYHIENALLLGKKNKDYQLALGKCKQKMMLYNEALAHFAALLKVKPTYIAAWEEIIRTLVLSGEKQAALATCEEALMATNHKPVLVTYYAAVLFLNKRKNDSVSVILNLLLNKKPVKVNILAELAPKALEHKSVADIINYTPNLKKQYNRLKK